MRMLARTDVEPEATIDAQHLTAIPFTDGGDLVREENSALEQVQSAEELDAVRLKVSLGKIGEVKIKSPETALLRKVMNRKHGGEGQLLVAHQHGNECRRPIVHVEDLRRRSHPARQLQRRFAKENESPGVIFVGRAVLPVNAGAIKKLIAAHKESLDPAGRAPLQEFRHVIFRADPNVHRDARLFRLDAGVFSDLTIIRHRYTDLVLP